jgi:pentatricopeptide repeat protein
VQCGDVLSARRVFAASNEKSVPLCGAMMKGKACLQVRIARKRLSSSLGFIVNNLANEAIELFSTIRNPNEIIVVLFLNSCAQVGTAQALQIGRQVIDGLPPISLRNRYVLNTVLDMFIRCGDVSSAENWFSKMKCHLNNYGQMMKGFNEANLPNKTLNLFEKMKSEGIKGGVITYLLLLDACSQLGIESICQSIVEQIPLTILDNVQIQTALIDMWVRQCPIPFVDVTFVVG